LPDGGLITKALPMCRLALRCGLDTTDRENRKRLQFASTFLLQTFA
jgi:hypothetical protein